MITSFSIGCTSWFTWGSSSARYIRLPNKHWSWPTSCIRNYPAGCTDHRSTRASHLCSIFLGKLSVADIYTEWNLWQKYGLLGNGTLKGLFMVLAWICHMMYPIWETIVALLVGASGHLESNKTRARIVTHWFPFHGIGPKWEYQQNGHCTGNVHFMWKWYI